MATYSVDASGDPAPTRLNFEDLWAHYERAGFLYHAKYERLAPHLPTIRSAWPRLLDAPDDVVRVLFALKDAQVRSSHSAFRDTDSTFVVHHATSENHAAGFRRCQVAQLAGIGASADIRFVGSFFRPDNRWALRLVKVICDAVGAERWTMRDQAYLVANPNSSPASHNNRDAVLAVGPQLASCGQFIAAVAGHMRASSLALEPGDPDEVRLAKRYAAAGQMHGRRIWYVERCGRIVAVAIRRLTDVPLNLSLLDRRAEILVHPDATDRVVIVRALAEALIADATSREEHVFPLLVEPGDVDGAVAAGFDDTGTIYNDVLWQSSAIERAVDAIRTLYARIDAREARRSQSAVAEEAVS